MSEYDVVVIGAGNGGLTSSLRLAKSGLRVMLLERHNVPGGCATSFIRGRFEFEVALHQLSGVGTEDFPGPVRGMLNELGVMDDLDFIRMDNLYRVVVPDRLDVSLKADRMAATATLKEKFPDQADNIDGFFNLLYAYCTQWISVVIMHDPEASREKYPTYFKYALKSSKDVFDEFITDDRLKAVLSVYWSYMGLPPSQLSFGLFAITLWAYLEFKPWHLKGGSQALSNTLLNAFLDAGGDVRFNCGAQKIIATDGAVKGVVTEEGDEISTKHVVSNAGTANTYIDLLDPDQVPEWRMRELGTRTVGSSFVTLFMGLDCEPGDLGIEQTTNFILADTDAERAYRKTKTLEAPEYTLMTCYDVDDPEFSPAGTCQVSAVALAYAEPWMTIPPNQYFDTKMAYAEKMLDLISRVFPDLRNHIEEVDVGTPLTHMRYLGHPGGAAYGFDQHAKDTSLFTKYASPIQGLFHVGAWSGSGGGFQPTLMSGDQAARKIIRTLNV